MCVGKCTNKTMDSKELLIKAFNDCIDGLNESPTWTSNKIIVGRIKPKFWAKGIIKITIETDPDEIENDTDDYKYLYALKRI